MEESHPLDIFLGKIIKGFYRDSYDAHMLNVLVNTITGYLFIPSCQLCAVWVVSAWEHMPEALVQKAYTVANYKTFEKLQKAHGEESLDNDIIIYEQNNIVDIIAECENSSVLIEQYLSPDNVYADGEFDDDNIVE